MLCKECEEPIGFSVPVGRWLSDAKKELLGQREHRGRSLIELTDRFLGVKKKDKKDRVKIETKR